MVGLKNGHIRKILTQKWWTPEERKAGERRAGERKKKKKKKKVHAHRSKREPSVWDILQWRWIGHLKSCAEVFQKVPIVGRPFEISVQVCHKALHMQGC